MTRWQGLLLSLTVLASTAWLASTGQLSLYIHPRYVLFTVLMAAVAAVFVIAAIVTTSSIGARRTASSASTTHDHAHEHQPHSHSPAVAPRSGIERFTAGAATWASVVVVTVATLALIVVPPATLTSGTAAAREMNAGTALDDDGFISIGGDYLNFTVKDWSGLLTQVSSPSFYEGKSVDVIGFVAADTADPENVYFVSRFIVTCCAVDAQPVGVPVYHPGWADELEADQWVHVIGPFITNPEADADASVLVDPLTVTVVDQPGDPYVH